MSFVPYRTKSREVPFGYSHRKAPDFRTYLDYLEAQLTRTNSVEWTLPQPPLEVYRVGYGLRVSDVAEALGKSSSAATTLLRGMRAPSPTEVQCAQDLSGGLVNRAIWEAWLSSDHSPAAKISEAQRVGMLPKYTKLHRVHLWSPSDARRRGRPSGASSRVWDPLKVQSVSLPQSLIDFVNKNVSDKATGFSSLSQVVRDALTSYVLPLGYSQPEKPEESELDDLVISKKKRLQVSDPRKVTTEILDTSRDTPLETPVEEINDAVPLPTPPMDFLAQKVEEDLLVVPPPIIFPHNYSTREASPRYSLPEDCDVEYSESGHLVFKKSFIDPGWRQDRELSPVYIMDDGTSIRISESGVEVATYPDGRELSSEHCAVEAIERKQAREQTLLDASVLSSSSSEESSEMLREQELLNIEYLKAQRAAQASFVDENEIDATASKGYDPKIHDPEYAESLDRARVCLLRGDSGLDILDRLSSSGIALEDIAELFKSLSMEVPR